MKKRIAKRKRNRDIKENTREWLKEMCHLDCYYIDSTPIEEVPYDYLKNYWSNNKRSINGIPKRSIRKQVYNEYKKLILELEAMTPEEIGDFFGSVPWILDFFEKNNSDTEEEKNK